MNHHDANMGAVRTKVKLTNALDKALVDRGSLAPRHLRECELDGLVDTGAISLVIPPAVSQTLGLKHQGQQIARYAKGYEEPIPVTEPVIIEIAGRKTTLEALVIGDEVLIGQVVLELLDLLPDCRNQRLLPNPQNPDYPVAIIK